MSDSFDPERQKRMLQNAQQSEPSGPGWTPLSAAAVNSTFAASSDFTQYEIIEPLGHGGMGAVHRGRDTKTSREVAVKLLRHDALHDNAFVTRFKKESHNLRRVNHYNVVRVFDEGEVEGYPFFVMELLEGHTLASEIERSGRMPLADIRRIMKDICAGLQAVHKEGLVHRDLKAANIFLVNDGRVVILDFGLARDVTATPSTLSVAGSEGHIAPEVLKGEPATHLSDIFSGGVIYMHLLTGTIPRGGQVQLHETYGLDPRLDEIVKKACNEDPKGRYQSAKDFAEALEAAMSPIPPRPVEPEPTVHRLIRASSQNAAELPPSGRMEVQFADARSVEQHRAFFRAYAHEKPILTGAIPCVGEKWHVVDEWDASHKVPKRGDGKKINPPALVTWSPDGKLLFTAADAWGLSAWDVGSSPRRLLDFDVEPWAYGYPRRFFVAQRGVRYRVLQETQSYSNTYYMIHNGDAHRMIQGANAILWQFGSSLSRPPLALNGNVGFNPWRPGSEFEVAFTENASSLKIVNISSIEKLEKSERGIPMNRGRLINRIIRFSYLFRSAPSWQSPLHDALAVHSLEFCSLGARGERIYGFLWHPSGEYLAVDTGDSDDWRIRRIHIVHVRSAQIVASIPAITRSLRWSPGGRFLLVKRWVPSSDGKLTAEAGVWDSTSFEIQFGELDTMLSQPWAMHGLHSGPQSPGDSFCYDKPDTALSLDGQRMLTEGGTVVTTVKREGCWVYPGEVLTQITEQRFSHAAWSPTDPRCFVTVGGGGSDKFPELYEDPDHIYFDGQQHHKCSHGQLLRMWRLR